MRRILLFAFAFTVMVSLCVFPSFATDQTDEVTETTDQSSASGEATPELVPRSERMAALLASYEAGEYGHIRLNMSDSIEYIFSDVLPGWASVAVWIGDQIKPDLFVYLGAMYLIFLLVGGNRRAKE